MNQFVVDVAQWLEHQVVALGAGGSIPLIHPKFQETSYLHGVSFVIWPVEQEVNQALSKLSYNQMGVCSMKLYRVNRRAGMMGWVFLCMWFACAAAFILLLAARNSYALLIGVVGLGFLVAWGTRAYNYPRYMLVSHTSMAFVMSGDNIMVGDQPEMKLDETPRTYVIELEKEGKSKRRFQVEKRNMTHELVRDIERIKRSGKE